MNVQHEISSGTMVDNEQEFAGRERQEDWEQENVGWQ